MTHTIPATEYIEIRRDGQYVATVQNGGLLPWFHQNSSFSCDWALTHEGYTLHPVEERYAVSYSVGATPAIFHKAFPTARGANRAVNNLFNKLTNEHINEGRIEVESRLERLVNGKWVAL